MASIELIDECNALSRRVSVPGGNIVVEAESLGDALAQIESLLGVRFTPFQGDESFEGGQYFVVDPPPPEPPFSISRHWRKLMLALGAQPRPWEIPPFPKDCIDIHIQRNNNMICPKQDLAFELLEGDKLVIPIVYC